MSLLLFSQDSNCAVSQTLETEEISGEIPEYKDTFELDGLIRKQRERKNCRFATSFIAALITIGVTIMPFIPGIPIHNEFAIVGVPFIAIGGCFTSISFYKRGVKIKENIEILKKKEKDNIA